jgi:hypothetical protein
MAEPAVLGADASGQGSTCVAACDVSGAPEAAGSASVGSVEGVVAGRAALVGPAKPVTASVTAAIDATAQLEWRFMVAHLLCVTRVPADHRADRNRASAGGSTASTIAAPEIAF